MCDFRNKMNDCWGQENSKRRAPGDAAAAPWNVAQLQQIGYGAYGPVVTVVDKVAAAMLIAY